MRSAVPSVDATRVITVAAYHMAARPAANGLIPSLFPHDRVPWVGAVPADGAAADGGIEVGGERWMYCFESLEGRLQALRDGDSRLLGRLAYLSFPPRRGAGGH